jgi:DNA polymerase I-like protein with 3'-5' exonuclease and polymerase domains
MSTIKRCFTSRFGKDGVIVEADYSQIEVVVQAFLSGDEQMKQDILDGIDFHCKRLSFKLKEDYEDVVKKCKDETNADYGSYNKMRKHIKVFSFQKAYGAGAPKIASTLSIPVNEVKEFFAIEEALYPSISVLQQEWIDEVERTKRPSTARTGKGFQACRGYISSVTGKRYIFTEDDIPSYMQKTWKNGKLEIKRIGFTPTKIKNYPVQGLAGELLYMAIGLLIRKILRDPVLRAKCILINTVHDSILFDVHKDILTEALVMIKSTMLSVPDEMNALYPDLGFDLPLKVDMEFGPSWLDTSKVEVEV